MDIGKRTQVIRHRLGDRGKLDLSYRFPANPLLGPLHPLRLFADAEKRDPRISACVVPVQLHHDGDTDHREVSAAAGDLLDCPASLGSQRRNADLGQEIVWLHGGSHVAKKEVFSLNDTLGTSAAQDQFRPED